MGYSKGSKKDQRGSIKDVRNRGVVIVYVQLGVFIDN